MARARSGGGGNGAMIGLVVFGAGFFICLILAILLYTQVSTAEQNEAAARSELTNVISSADQNDTLAQITADIEGRTTVAKLLNYIDERRKEINGLQGDVVNITSARDLAATEAQQNREAAEQARADLARLSDNRTALEAELRGQVQGMSSTIADISAENDRLKSRIDQSIIDVENSYRQQIDQLNDRVSTLNSEVSRLERVISDQQVTIIALKGETPEPIPLTDADATIVAQLPDQDKVYLGIGSDQNLVKGMSFTVFDPDVLVKLEGDDLNQGKAVIDIINVDNTTAVGLIVERKPRAVIRDGDAVVNIAYDPRRKYSFHVFGQFDLDFDEEIDDFGLDTVKNLVTRSNGQLADEIGYTTDFLVLGLEPELPVRPDDELDLLKMREYRVELENFQLYQDRIALAREFGIPVLSQNRFLDLVGFTRR
ncbi:MAG: hypothetical protein AAF333_03310 [Planctomycetota bacterium]